MKNNHLLKTSIIICLFLPAASSQAMDACGKMSKIECTMVREINKVREAHHLSNLSVSAACVAEAQEHAKDMDRNNYFSHDGLKEKWEDRMKRFKLTDGFVGENIAQGFDVPGAVNVWMNSPPHRENILNADYTSTGVGYSNEYWVQCFSGPAKTR